MTSKAIVFVLILTIGLLSLTLVNAVSEDILEQSHAENIAFKQDVYESIKRFVENNPQFNRLDELYFRIAELSTDLYPNDPAKVLSYYRQVLRINPNFPLEKDAVLYNIAYFSTELAKKQRDEGRQQQIQSRVERGIYDPIDRWSPSLRLSEESMKEPINAYNEILLNHPDSKFYSETLYRLALLYYDIAIDADEPVRYYEKARDYFNILAEREGDDLQHFGLYQRGWAHFSTNQFEKSIQDFAEILNLVTDDTEFRAYFEQDAIENIAYSLERMDESDYSGEAASALYAREVLPQLVNEERYQKDILQRVVDVKLELNAPQHAIDYYNTKIAMFPSDLKNPALVDSIITLYSQYSFLEPDEQNLRQRIVNHKMKLIDDFGVDSEWYQANNSKQGFAEQLEILREAFEFVEPTFRNRLARDTNEENLFEYENLISSYAEFPQFSDEKGQEWLRERHNVMVNASLIMADEEDTPESNYRAWYRLADFNDRYPDHEDFMEYEVNRYLIFAAFYNSLLETIENTPFVYERYNLSLSEAELTDLYLGEVERFIQAMNAPDFDSSQYADDIVAALYRRSQIYLEREMLSEAEEDLIAILDYDVPTELKRDIFVHLAQINENFRNYSQAEDYYRRATEYAETAEDRDNLSNAYKRQILAKASDLADESSYIDAAEEYLRLSEEFKDTDADRAVGYKQEAIEAFIKAGEYQRSIDLLLELSELRTDPAAVYYLYYSAWNIADTLLTDESYVKNLREEFIAQHPSSNEAYSVRYQMINELALNPETKYEAGERLLELHQDAAAGNIDIGEDNPEDIFYDALDIYSDYPDEMYSIELMLEFEKTYPNDPRANDLLELVAVKYDEKGMTEEFEELARYIFAKDPESQFYENIARRKLHEVYTEATELFQEEEYEAMLAKITEFETKDQAYREENLNLPLDDYYADFGDYKFVYDQVLIHREFVSNMETKLNEIENEFVNADPNELFRVNNNTRWQEHIQGRGRLDALVDQAHEQEELLAGLLQEAVDIENQVNMDVPLGLKSKALFLPGRIYERSAEVLEIQLGRYYEIGMDMRELREFDEDEYQTSVAWLKENFEKPYVDYLYGESASRYSNYVSIFIQDLNHEDEYTQYAQSRLSDWGLLTEQITLYSNLEWSATKTQDMIDNIEFASWEPVAVLQTSDDLLGIENTEAIPIWLDTQESETAAAVVSDTLSTEPTHEATVYMRKFEVEGEVVDAQLRFAAFEKSSIWINGVEIVSDIEFSGEDTEADSNARTINVDPVNFVPGENIVLIKSNGAGEKQGFVFDLSITVTK